MEVRDVAIIGSGPAGVSSVINAHLRNLTYYFFGNHKYSDKITKTSLIENIPGVMQISGQALVSAYAKQLEDMQIAMIEKLVSNIYRLNDYYMIIAENEMYYAKNIILALGVQSMASIENEVELLGRGVSYCATCDGNLYRDKDIVVIAQNKEYENEVEFLASLAHKVYYLPLFKSDLALANVERLMAMVKKVEGKMRVEKVVLANGETLNIDGIFILKDSVALNALLPDLEIKDGHIVVDRMMRTNLKGCYACGDCVGRPYQIVKAYGEGNVAIHTLIEDNSKKDD